MNFKNKWFFYLSPSNFNYWWNFGFIALYFLFSQIITGIFLAMFYNANMELAFKAIIDINNEIYYGWWLRYIHSNGASFFFIFVYLHMCRGLYYGSFIFPRQILWMSGVIIWVLMVATAFLGYILPWGQMSFWGATVITSLLGAIPFVGNEILFLLWGNYSIGNATLHRFFSLHYTFPFIILFVVIMHLLLLHEFSSGNPLNLSSGLDMLPFNPYYTLKDGFSIIIVLIFFFFIIFSAPDLLGHSDNYIEANFLVTPAHIVPEWYFLPLYAILRAVTNKLLGIFLLLCFILFLLFLPIIMKYTFIKSALFKPLYNFLIWLFFINCFLLGWIGGLPVMTPYIELGLISTIFHFFLILFLLPGCIIFEFIVYEIYINKNVIYAL